ASSSACSRMRSPIRQINRPRSLEVRRRHGPDSNARRAAITARSISSLSLSATRAMTEASAGLKTSNVLPDAAGTHLQPIKFNFGRFSQLATRELIPGVARLDEWWPFPWLPLVRLLSAGVLMRRCEVVLFIGLELDTFSSRIYDS